MKKKKLKNRKIVMEKKISFRISNQNQCRGPHRKVKNSKSKTKFYVTIPFEYRFEIRTRNENSRIGTYGNSKSR